MILGWAALRVLGRSYCVFFVVFIRAESKKTEVPVLVFGKKFYQVLIVLGRVWGVVKEKGPRSNR